MRRARALQDVLLPELDRTLYEIETRLEELEQEDAIWMRPRHDDACVNTIRRMDVRKTVLVGHSAERMFDLIEAAEHYPDFLPWCAAATIVARDADVVVADIDRQLPRRALRLPDAQSEAASGVDGDPPRARARSAASTASGT